MGTPPTETATGAARSAASPAAAGTRSPNPTQLAAAASASRTRIGILQFSQPPNELAQQRRGLLALHVGKNGRAPAVCCSAWFGVWATRRSDRLAPEGGRSHALLVVLRPLGRAGGVQRAGKLLHELLHLVVVLRLPAIADPELAVLVFDGELLEQPPQALRQPRAVVHCCPLAIEASAAERPAHLPARRGAVEIVEPSYPPVRCSAGLGVRGTQDQRGRHHLGAQD